MSTKLLDLDVVSNAVEFSLKLEGVNHEMVEPTVESFIQTVKRLEDMPLNVTPAQELNLAIDMILDVFPTIKREQLTKLTLSQIRKISEFVRKASGQDVEAESINANKSDATEGNVAAAS